MLQDSIRPGEDGFEAFLEYLKRTLFSKPGIFGSRRHTIPTACGMRTSRRLAYLYTSARTGQSWLETVNPGSSRSRSVMVESVKVRHGRVSQGSSWSMSQGSSWSMSQGSSWSMDQEPRPRVLPVIMDPGYYPSSWTQGTTRHGVPPSTRHGVPPSTVLCMTHTVPA